MASQLSIIYLRVSVYKNNESQNYSLRKTKTSYFINSIRMAKIGLCYLKMDFSKLLDSKYLIFMKTMASK